MSNVNEIEVISISSDSDNDVGTVEVRSEGSELEDGEIVDADEGKDVVIGGNQTHALAIRGLPKHYRKSGKLLRKFLLEKRVRPSELKVTDTMVVANFKTQMALDFAREVFKEMGSNFGWNNLSTKVLMPLASTGQSKKKKANKTKTGNVPTQSKPDPCQPLLHSRKHGKILRKLKSQLTISFLKELPNAQFLRITNNVVVKDATADSAFKLISFPRAMLRELPNSFWFETCCSTTNASNLVDVLPMTEVVMRPNTNANSVILIRSNYTVEEKCVSDHILRVVDLFKKYLQTSKHMAYNPALNTGFWRRMLVRGNSSGHVMVVLYVTSGLSLEAMDKIKNDLVQVAVGGAIASLYITAVHNCERTAAPIHLMGATHLVQRVNNDWKYLIAPETPFPDNESLAVTMYKTIIKHINLKNDCGPIVINCGVLWLILAKRCQIVFCIDHDAHGTSWKDAELNADENNIDNVIFRCGSVEEELTKIVDQYSGFCTENNGMPVFLDASATHPQHVQAVFRVLRNSPTVHRVIVMFRRTTVSSNEFIELCASAADQSQNNVERCPSFVPVSVLAFDLYENVPDVFLVLKFVRRSVATE